MAQSNPPLLERDALASLNQLRDGPQPCAWPATC
jgi:hypothetical protein